MRPRTTGRRFRTPERSWLHFPIDDYYLAVSEPHVDENLLPAVDLSLSPHCAARIVAPQFSFAAHGEKLSDTPKVSKRESASRRLIRRKRDWRAEPKDFRRLFCEDT